MGRGLASMIMIKNELMTNLPIKELTEDLHAFLDLLTAQLPDHRLRKVRDLTLRGIIDAQLAIITEIARILIHNEVTIRSSASGKSVYTQWRDRPHIEYIYRFDQKEGFDIEDVRV